MGQCFGRKAKDEGQDAMPQHVNGEQRTVSTYQDESGKVTRTTTTTKRVVQMTGGAADFKDVPLDEGFRGSTTVTSRRIVKRTIVRMPDGTEQVTEQVVVEGDDSLLPDSKADAGSKSDKSSLGSLFRGKTKTTDAAAPKVPAVSGVTLKTTDKQFREESLKRHNHYRAKHGVPPLKHSEQLCKYAQEWADTLAKRDKFEHRPNNKFGENIYMAWSSDPSKQVSGAEAVDSWYSEIKDYTFGVEPRTLASGHFTQVIWKGSSELGTARARSATGKILVVSNYSPAGNMVGSFAANVPPPCK